MKRTSRTKEQLLAENEDLRRRLDEAEETLRAIQEGEVDALVLSKPQGDVVFTLKGAEHPYRVFVEAMNEGAATLDPEGTILYCNNRFGEMLQLPVDTVIGSSISRFIPAPDLSGFEAAFQQGKQQETTVDIFLERADHERIPVHLSFNMLPGQEMPVVCMIAMDLTEHKRLEEALRQLNADLEKRIQDRTAELRKMNEALRAEIAERQRVEESLQESEEKYRLLVEHAPAGIYEIDFTERRFKTVNEAACRMLGYTEAELLAMNPADMLGRDSRNTFLDRVRKAQTGETLSDYIEYKAKRKDGSDIWGLLHSKFKYRDGRIVGAFVVVHDITERKGMEEELRKSRDELESRVQERTEELARARKRLQGLAAQLLVAQERERKRVAVELHDGILSELAALKMLFEAKMIRLEQGNLSDLREFKRVSDILALVMREARGIMNNLHPSILDELGLIAAINWLAEEYQKSYPHIRVQKRIEVSEQDISDSIKVVIFRVLQEALNNFAKHGKGDRVDLSLSKANGSFTLVVRDNGQGFDVETAQKGLGLESMRERVEISEGEFQLESAIGQGTAIRAIWSI